MPLLASALRSLRARPGFNLLIVLLLAVGIGANTAIFSVVHAVLLKPLPYPQSGDLVTARKLMKDAGTQVPGGGDMMPDTELLAWLDAVPKSFRGLAGYRSNAATLQRGDGAVRVPSAAVTADFFSLLGVSAWRGRLFSADDLKPGAAPVTVLSHTAWVSRFGGDDSAVGQVVKIDDVAHTVIGVLPPSFEFTDPVQFWRPLPLTPSAPGQLRIQMLRVFGRLLPGTPLAVAQQELAGISERYWNNLSSSFNQAGPQPAGPGPQRIVRALPPGGPAPGAAAGPERQAIGGPGGPGPAPRPPFADAEVQLVPLQEQLARQSRTTLWLLLGAVGFVLLIACANVASLQLARAAERRRESAIRAALGASPRRLAATLLLENLFLALAGGALGALLAWWGTLALQTWLADYLPRINPVGVSLPVLGFALGLAALAGLGFGLAPAWQGSRVDLLETLKEGGLASLSGGQRWRQGLVALEIALALVLAVNTGLLARSIYQLYSAELGFRTSDVLTADLALPRRYRSANELRDFADRWLVLLRTLPGVKSAAVTDSPPLSGFNQVMLVSRARDNASASTAPAHVTFGSVSPDFFPATGIALRAGRTFTDQDGANAPVVAIVNEEYARAFLPNGFSPGATVDLPRDTEAKATIVGVVANTRTRGFESTPIPTVYFPISQQPRPRVSAVLQFEGDAAALSRALAAATHKLDAELALDNPATLESRLARQTAPRRVTLLLTGIFAITAVGLAALGIFGTMSYTVTQRTQEIGVRMALGAAPTSILRWIFRTGLRAIGLGLAAGLALTFATQRLLQSTLTGVAGLESWIVVAATALLLLVGLAACLLPAWRATRVNPVEALRAE